MRGEQAIFNLEIKKKSGLSLNPDIHHSKVFSSVNVKHGTFSRVFFKTSSEQEWVRFCRFYVKDLKATAISYSMKGQLKTFFVSM